MSNLRVLFFLISVIYLGNSVQSQDDDIYYLKKNQKQQKEYIQYPWHVHVDLIRPFYRDINVNFEFSLRKNLVIDLGIGFFPPRQYRFWYLGGVEKFSDYYYITTEKPGFRYNFRVKEYLMDYMDGPLVSLMVAYNSMPDFKYMEYIGALGYVLPLYKNLTICPEIGLKFIHYRKYGYNLTIDQTLAAGLYGNVSLGYRFKQNKKDQNEIIN